MSVEIKNEFVKKANEIARWSEVFNKELAQKFDELDQIRFEYRTTYEKMRKRLGNQVTFDQRYGAMKRVLCEEARFKVSADVLLDFNDLVEEVLSGADNNNNSDAESLTSSENQQTEVEYDQSRLKELFRTEACNNKGADCNDECTQSPISLSPDSQENVKKYASSLSDSSGQENVEPILDRLADKNNNSIQRKFDISDHSDDQENSQKKTETPDKDKNGIKRRCVLFAGREKNRENADLESKENKKYPVHFVHKIPKIKADFQSCLDKRESLSDIEKPKSYSQPVVRLSIECLNNIKAPDKSPEVSTQKSNPEKTIPSFKQFKE